MQNIKSFLNGIKDEIKYRETKEYIKKLIEKIIKDECLESEINYKDLNLYVISTFDYYKNVFKNRSFKLGKISYKISPNNAWGFSDNTNNVILVFLCNGVINNIATAIEIAYHEITHYKDKLKLKVDNPLSLALYMDNQVAIYDKKYYKLNHNELMHEIHANVNGVDKAINFILKNRIHVEKEDLKYLIERSALFHYDEENYDFFETFDRFIKVYRKNYDRIELPEILQVFLNKNGSFKDYNDIINNPLIKKEDMRYCGIMVMVSDTFNREVKIDSKLLKKIDKWKSTNKRLIIEYNLECFSNNIELTDEDNSYDYMYHRDKRLERFKKKYPNIEIEYSYESKFRK